MAALYLLGLTGGIHAQDPPPPAPTPALDPDALYREREDLSKAGQAADLWAQAIAVGPNFEAAWKLARACYWIGAHAGTEPARRAALERGVKAGEEAARLEPRRPEGHFWTAANMGALAESFGLLQGLKYRGRIKDALERARAIDPAWEQGSADRALGRWYARVPGLFGGSRKKAEAHLRRALGYNPASPATLVFLAEVLLADKRTAEARTLLRRALEAPLDPAWAPEDRDFKRRAAALLEERDRLPRSTRSVLVEPLA